MKGILLYGLPMRIIARKIGEMLKARPCDYHGPELLNKYVGASEENVGRCLRPRLNITAGDESELHIIIMDEIELSARHVAPPRGYRCVRQHRESVAE